MRDTTRESALVRAVLDYLTLRGVCHWRNNSGALKVGNRLVRFGTPGSADILAVLAGGRLLAIECKRRGQSLRQAQRAWLAAVEQAGGIACVARSLDDVMAVVEGER